MGLRPRNPETRSPRIRRDESNDSNLVPLCWNRASHHKPAQAVAFDACDCDHAFAGHYCDWTYETPRRSRWLAAECR